MGKPFLLVTGRVQARFRDTTGLPRYRWDFRVPGAVAARKVGNAKSVGSSHLSAMSEVPELPRERAEAPRNDAL